MTSILTNSAAMAALQTLRSINSNMEEVQNRISSGYRVETAADNAAYWSIATTMRSDNAALSTVQDALGLGAAKIDTSYAGMSSAIDVVSEIKAKLVAAREPGGGQDQDQQGTERAEEPAGIRRRIRLPSRARTGSTTTAPRRPAPNRSWPPLTVRPAATCPFRPWTTTRLHRS